MFRRKKWRYLILDEAHMIKNWKSQRWQTLLRFNSKRRLLITGGGLREREEPRGAAGGQGRGATVVAESSLCSQVPSGHCSLVGRQKC